MVITILGRKYPVDRVGECLRMRQGYWDKEYARVQFYGKKYRVIRLLVNLFPGELACHTCDNAWCVNRDHLYPGTHATNNQDARDRGRFVPRGPVSTSI